VDHFGLVESFGAATERLGTLFADRLVYGERVALVKPQSYMNLSGPPVRAVVRYFAGEILEPERGAGGDTGEGASGKAAGGKAVDLSASLLVVCDDLDLPMGKLRFRARGSSGGHRGVASIIEALGTERFSRLRVGIGRPEGGDAAAYVLERLGGESEQALSGSARRAAETLPLWIQEGVAACANRFNGPQEGNQEYHNGNENSAPR
jgi:PTH1 family peptidyl-tRNA hydrolase